MASQEYDFILVGAGTASCLIASRLSQQLPDHKILVLEAGEHVQDDPKIKTPGLSASMQSDATYDWGYKTEAEPGLNDRSIKHPRGKLVGGSSAINSHSVVYPNHEWQDRVAELLPEAERADWTSKAMADCYDRWQATGNDGPSPVDVVRTSYPRSLSTLQTQWMKVFEDLGHSKTGFTESTAGAVTITNAIDSSKGERSHAGIALLEPALRHGNVTLKTGVKIDKVVFNKALSDGKLTARGVAYTKKGKEQLVNGREIIICAGAFESPALLERSGIGSRKVLEVANVPVLNELPGVGENLQDHLNISISCEVQDGIPTRDVVIRGEEDEQARAYRIREGAAYSFAFTPLQMLETASETQELTAQVEHAVSQSDPALRAQYDIIQKAIESPTEASATTRMLQIQRNTDSHALPPDAARSAPGNFVSITSMLAHPFSRGTVHITSPSPEQHPSIKFNYLSHPLDVEILARHVRFNERLFARPAFRAITKYPEGRKVPLFFPYPMTKLEDAKRMLPVCAATNYHPSSTCSMMREEIGGVVDGRLLVYGTRNVRICDASVLPVIPRGNILSAVYAYAEKAAEIIVREAKGKTQT